MGCAATKAAALESPGCEVSAASAAGYEAVSTVPSSVGTASIWSRPVRLEVLDLGADGDGREEVDEEKKKKKSGLGGHDSAARLGINMRQHIDVEQVAAGWPAWLSSVAAEAVQGWVPLKAENFEKINKIGQGTYSSVFRARSLETGRLVALKKVRFDSVEQESVRFMAREIVILRRLQRHPNVVGLEGLITSRSAPNIYLVFEYMEHDLAGLTSSPDLSFSQPQIKCYMKQLLAGLEHCHARGVMHRDIKCANLLVSNDGELKVADFGLANFFTPSSPAPLTSRVVTLWYRPPELLLGATAYEPSVDLWSAGCVFAEMHSRRPILQGRTEVEQIHKIFNLCGSPPDDYWRRARMSHAAVFRPHHPHQSRLRDTFRSMQDEAFRLLDTLLSVEPSARGNASDALASDYFTTEPYACDPSSLPKYAPNKEMDAKLREDSRRRNNGSGSGEAAAGKRMSRATKSMQDTTLAASQRNHGHVHAEESLPEAVPQKDGDAQSLFFEMQPDPVIASKRHDDAGPPCSRQMSRRCQEEEEPRLTNHLPLSGPVQLAPSTGFAWAKKTTRLDATVTAKRNSSMAPRTNSAAASDAGSTRTAAASAAATYEVEKQQMIKQWAHVAEAFSPSEAYNNRSIRDPMVDPLDAKQFKTNKRYKGQRGTRVDFSGPLLSQPRRIDDLLQNREQQIRQAIRRSWFHKGSKREQH